MHELGYLESLQKDYGGNLFITFKIDSEDTLIEKLQKEFGEQLVIDVKKFRKGRSLDANAYFWQLCDKMAKKLNSTKDTIYLLMLQRYGVFTDVRVLEDGIPILEKTFRYVERFNEYTNDDGFVDVRCYFGSSGYDSKEMSELINGTVFEAKELGIETLTPQEIAHMLSVIAQKEVKNK